MCVFADRGLAAHCRSGRPCFASYASCIDDLLSGIGTPDLANEDTGTGVTVDSGTSGISGRGVLISKRFLSYAGVGSATSCLALFGAELSPRFLFDIACSLMMSRLLLILYLMPFVLSLGDVTKSGVKGDLTFRPLRNELNDRLDDTDIMDAAGLFISTVLVRIAGLLLLLLLGRRGGIGLVLEAALLSEDRPADVIGRLILRCSVVSGSPADFIKKRPIRESLVVLEAAGMGGVTFEGLKFSSSFFGGDDGFLSGTGSFALGRIILRKLSVTS